MHFTQEYYATNGSNGSGQLNQNYFFPQLPLSQYQETPAQTTKFMRIKATKRKMQYLKETVLETMQLECSNEAAGYGRNMTTPILHRFYPQQPDILLHMNPRIQNYSSQLARSSTAMATPLISSQQMFNIENKSVQNQKKQKPNGTQKVIVIDDEDDVIRQDQSQQLSFKQSDQQKQSKQLQQQGLEQPKKDLTGLIQNTNNYQLKSLETQSSQINLTENSNINDKVQSEDESKKTPIFEKKNDKTPFEISWKESTNKPENIWELLKMISETEARLSDQRITHFQQLPGYVIPQSISVNNSEDLLITQVLTPRKVRINNRASPFFIERPQEFKLSLNTDKLISKINKSRINSQAININSSDKLKKLNINQNQQTNSQPPADFQKRGLSSSSKEIQQQKQQFSQKQQQQQDSSSPSSQQLVSPLEQSVQQPPQQPSQQQHSSSRFAFCKKCEKQIDLHHAARRNGGEIGEQLCRICFQNKQKDDFLEKRFWELVFHNQDGPQMSEVGKEYQAAIPSYFVSDSQQWREENKLKFQAILASKTHSASDNQIYTDVITMIRQKYNQNYSHNEFSGFLKTINMSLSEMKEKLLEEDEQLLNTIKSYSSNVTRNQRVTRLTKRRLENLQNY